MREYDENQAGNDDDCSTNPDLNLVHIWGEVGDDDFVGGLGGSCGDSLGGDLGRRTGTSDGAVRSTENLSLRRLAAGRRAASLGTGGDDLRDRVNKSVLAGAAQGWRAAKTVAIMLTSSRDLSMACLTVTWRT